MRAAMAKPMVIVSSFEILYNKNGEYHEVLVHEAARCPYCGGALRYRNRKQRSVLDELREKIVYLLRRLWCEGCKSLHTEIPDFIQPHRHYSSLVIQDVIDGGGEACAADDSTIRRWRNDFEEAKADIEQRLKSVYARETDSHAPFASETKTLNGLIKRETRWLSYVMWLLIRHGHRPCTRFAFCQREEAVSIAGMAADGGKGDGFYDNSKEDTG